MLKLSVIVPVFNTERYLEKCLTSVANQTLKDIEIICIDDGSTDSSADILKGYASGDERFKIVSQENSGAAASRNRAIDMAKGEYLFFLDADDWLEADAFEKLYSNAKSNDSDMVLFNSIERYEDSERERIYMPVDDSVDYNDFTFDYNLEKRLVMNRMLVVWSKLYKTSFVKDNDIRFDELKVFNDMGFHIKSMVLAKRISYLPEILYNYNKTNETSLQSIKTDYNKRLIIFDVFDNVEAFLLDNNYFNTFRLNFYEFKINESEVQLNRTSDAYKEDYYQTMRREFIKMDIGSQELKALPFRLYRFYMTVLNIGQYELYQKFHRLKNSPFKYIDKHGVQAEIDNFTQMGINEDKRSPRLIVSLTSYPKRMGDIHFCLYSLLKQNFKPDEVVLWLTEEEFPNGEEDVPQNVLDLKKNGLTIKWTRNLRSYTKLIPSLKEYPDDFIVTADDDLFYPEDWLERLWRHHLKYPECIISHRSRRLGFNSDSSPKPYGTWKLIEDDIAESYLNLQTGVGGVLYFPNSLSENVFRDDIFQKIAPSTDDLWFWAMAVLNGVKIKAIPKSNMIYLCYVNYAREFGFLEEKSLWRFNSTGGNIESLNNILNSFPEILDIINQEEKYSDE